MAKNPRPSLADAQASKRTSYSQQAEAAKQTAGQTAGRQAGEKTRRLNVNIPEAMYARFQHAAESEGRSMTWIVRQLVERYTEDHEQGDDLVKQLRAQG